MENNLRVGDQVIYNGHLYWLRLVIEMGPGNTIFALRQAHWPKEFYILVNSRNVLRDVPFTA